MLLKYHDASEQNKNYNDINYKNSNKKKEREKFFPVLFFFNCRMFLFKSTDNYCNSFINMKNMHLMSM